MPALAKGTKVFLAGHRGLVGSAIHRALEAAGEYQVVTRSRQELDLTDQASTYRFLQEARVDCVIVAAAKVGGILANSTYPADFIGINLTIQNNLIWGSHLADVPTLLFLGSSCIYPRETTQPIPEDALLTGPLEPTNAPYAIAKIAGLMLCDSISKQYGKRYFTVMPPNVYGPRDNFDPATSHVLAALIRRFHEALPNGDVVCWGTGRPKREFLYADDIADACLFLLSETDHIGFFNVGTGSSVTIAELATQVQSVVGHSGKIDWDLSKPDGFPEKTMNIRKISSMGWRPKVDLREGIKLTYDWFLDSLLG